MEKKVKCPVCSTEIPEREINEHLDQDCVTFVPSSPTAPSSSLSDTKTPLKPQGSVRTVGKGKDKLAPIFQSQATAQSPNSLGAPASSSRSTDPMLFSSQKPRTAPASGPSSTTGLSQLTVEPPRSNHTLSSNRTKRPSTDPFFSQSLLASSSTGAVDRPPPAKRKKAESHLESAAPLAERLRPASLKDFVGQGHLTGPDSLMMANLARGHVGSIILWGPPGCGKTTLARLLAKESNATFKELSATSSGINEVRAVFEEARGQLQLIGRKTVLFLDEIHRFTKAQQDIFLPFVEQGQIQLIGATTENPSFKLTGALLSRCRVFVLEKLSDDDMCMIINNAIKRILPPMAEPEGQSTVTDNNSTTASTTADSSQSDGSPSAPEDTLPQLTRKVMSSIISLASGDARTALSLLELVITSPRTTSEAALLDALRQSVSTSYDRTGDSHYDHISALHKSLRGSQGSAAMYWLARMLCAGEDPVFIARRLVVFASEDVGLADAHALPLAMATMQACQQIGMPECRINLAHLVAYLAEAPKSIRSYEAYQAAEAAAKRDMSAPVPMMVRNAPTKLMKELEYGRGYVYNPEFAHPVHNEYLPQGLEGSVFLKTEQEYRSSRAWDEEELKIWEQHKNDGAPWLGRMERLATNGVQATAAQDVNMNDDDVREGLKERLADAVP